VENAWVGKVALAGDKRVGSEVDVHMWKKSILLEVDWGWFLWDRL